MAKTPEGYVLDALCEYLATKGYIFWRQNTVGVYDVGQQRYRTMPRYSMKGVSDIIVLVDGTAMFIEAKAGKGKQSPDQQNFQQMVEMAGCKYFVARSIDDLISQGF